jgi:hypothetical protein
MEITHIIDVRVNESTLDWPLCICLSRNEYSKCWTLHLNYTDPENPSRETIGFKYPEEVVSVLKDRGINIGLFCRHLSANDKELLNVLATEIRSRIV